MKLILAASFALAFARASCSEPPPDTHTASTAPGDESTDTQASAAPSGSSDAPSANATGDAGPQRIAPREIAARHILVMYRGSQRSSATRTREEARARAEEALRRARGGEDFAALVREYSDEPNAGARGGALGRFGHGMMVPAFERAAFALEVGEMSGVVETDFGFHVIQRTE